VGLGLPAGLLGHHAADVDQVVGNHPEADPALHSGIPLVPAAIKSVPSLDHADATLASGTPFLAVAEPALLLLAFALGALRGAIGDADALDALGFGGRRVLGRVEAGIGRHQARCAPEHCLMGFDRGHQQVRVAGALIIDFVGDDDLVLRLLQFDHLGVTTRKCSECTTSWTKHERAARWYGRSTLDGCRSGGGRSHVSDVPRAYVYRASPEPPQSTRSGHRLPYSITSS